MDFYFRRNNLRTVFSRFYPDETKEYVQCPKFELKKEIKMLPQVQMMKVIPKLSFLAFKALAAFSCVILNQHEKKIDMSNTFAYYKAKELYASYITMVEQIKQILFRDFNAMIYGGFPRSWHERVPANDIDVRFKNREHLEECISQLIGLYNVEILVTRGDEDTIFSKICVQHLNHNDLNVYCDFSWFSDIASKNAKYDFDVNQLCMIEGGIGLLPGIDNDVRNVIENIVRREFIVLDAFGMNSLEHETNAQCILQNTAEGKGIFLRIQKMIKRGWTCINEPCKNWNCILASESVVKHHEKVKLMLLNDLKEQKKIINSHYQRPVHNNIIIPFQKSINIEIFNKKIKSDKITKLKKMTLLKKQLEKGKYNNNKTIRKRVFTKRETIIKELVAKNKTKAKTRTPKKLGKGNRYVNKQCH